MDECAYVANSESRTVSVINTAAQALSKIIQLPNGREPAGVAFTPDGAFAYVANSQSNNVSVIDTTTRLVVAEIPVGISPARVAITPNAGFAYVTNNGSDDVSVIDTSTTQVVATVPVGDQPMGIAVTPNGAFAYVTNFGSNDVSVIATSSNSVTQTVPVRRGPSGVATTPNGAFAYVANSDSKNISVVPIGGAAPIATIPVDDVPRDVAIKADGTLLYVLVSPGFAGSGFAGISLPIIDTATNIQVGSVNVSGSGLSGGTGFGIAASPAGGSVYVTWTDDLEYVLCTLSAANPDPCRLATKVSRIDTASNSVAGSIMVVGGRAGATLVAVSPDGAFAYVTSSGAAWVVSVAASAVTGVIGIESHPEDIAVDGIGSTAYAVDEFLYTVDLTASAVHHTGSVGGSRLVITPGGRDAYITRPGSKRVAVVATATGVLTKTIDLDSAVEGMAITPSGATIYIAQPTADQISVIETASNTLTSTIFLPINDLIVAHKFALDTGTTVAGEFL